MAERYSTLLEMLAEWFMNLFFDPMYHYSGSAKKGLSAKVERIGQAIRQLKESRLKKPFFWDKKFISKSIKATSFTFGYLYKHFRQKHTGSGVVHLE